jgi:copper transport protein
MGALGLAATIRMHDRRPALSRLTLVEVTAGAGLLLAVGALTVQAPPLGPSGTAPAATERTASGAMDDLRVTVSATPNQPGLNWFTVLAQSTRRPEPYPIDDVALRVGGSHGDTVLPLRPLVPGRYMATYRVDEAGPLHMVAVVHRGGHEQQVRIGWTVEAAGAAAAIPPGRGLAPYADAVALVLLEGAVVAGAWLLLRRQRRRRIAVPDDAAEISDELVSGGSR